MNTDTLPVGHPFRECPDCGHRHNSHSIKCNRSSSASVADHTPEPRNETRVDLVDDNGNIIATTTWPI